MMNSSAPSYQCWHKKVKKKFFLPWSAKSDVFENLHMSQKWQRESSANHLLLCSTKERMFYGLQQHESK